MQTGWTRLAWKTLTSKTTEATQTSQKRATVEGHLDDSPLVSPNDTFSIESVPTTIRCSAAPLTAALHRLHYTDTVCSVGDTVMQPPSLNLVKDVYITST